MCTEKLITGVKVSSQMERAREILEKKVIPKEKLFQTRKKKQKLSSELVNALRANA
ncbi:MAG: hypothetical protein GY705_14590 [Bacteroidetes bacterium]|nr:hypothetical protein [Bacteroidota bacterium]